MRVDNIRFTVDKLISQDKMYLFVSVLSADY